MNNKASILILVIILVLATNCIAQELDSLTITVANLKNERGQAVVNLFREQDDLPKKPFKTIKAQIKSGLAKFIFENLPHGSYAVIVYHDENGNGTLDHKLGFPNEPMGFSNNWNLSIFSGMPAFRKLRFEHNGSQAQVAIEID